MRVPQVMKADEWFKAFASEFWRVLSNDGSLVIHIGGSREKGYPIRLTYHFELLLELCRPSSSGPQFYLARDFYCAVNVLERVHLR